MPHFEVVIHPTAIIHPKAKLDSTVQTGPFVVVDADVEIGPDCVIGPHAYFTGVTKIGSHNRFHAGCVIGDAPQDLKYHGEPTGLRIGDHNVFREHVTVHRSNKPGEETIIGSHNYLMQHSHAGHNSVVGDHVILASGSLLAGHVVIQDRAFISGNCMVHQFTRIGYLSMMQGGAGVSKDVPPFAVAVGVNEICGLNIVGLRRADFNSKDRLELKRLYHALFRSGQNLRAAAESAQASFAGPAARVMLEFIISAKKGVCSDVGASRIREVGSGHDPAR